MGVGLSTTTGRDEMTNTTTKTTKNGSNGTNNTTDQRQQGELLGPWNMQSYSPVPQGVHAALLALQARWADSPEPVQLQDVRAAMREQGCTLVVSYQQQQEPTGPYTAALECQCCCVTISDATGQTITATSPPLPEVWADDAVPLAVAALIGQDTESGAQAEERQSALARGELDTLRAENDKLRRGLGIESRENERLESEVAELQERLQRPEPAAPETIGDDWDDELDCEDLDGEPDAPDEGWDEELDPEPDEDLAGDLAAELAALENEVSDLQGGPDA